MNSTEHVKQMAKLALYCQVALDVAGQALAGHLHRWSKKQRASYEKAQKMCQKYIKWHDRIQSGQEVLIDP